MNLQEYNELAGKFDEAQENTKPFLVMDNGEPIVVGDANDIAINAHDFKIEFRVPGESGKYEVKTKEYNNVFISPMKATFIRPILLEVMPFFSKPKSDGTVGKYTNEEAQDLLNEMGSVLIAKMYDLVAAVLGIPQELTEWITLDSMLESFAKIIVSYQELIREGDMLFQDDSK